MAHLRAIMPYALRRYLAFSLDLLLFAVLMLPLFMGYLLIPPLHNISHNISQKNYWEAAVNFFTLGQYSIIVRIIDFIVQLFAEGVNSIPLFWAEFTQLIKQIIVAEISAFITMLSANIIFYTTFILYKAGSESSSKQASIGKRIVGLKVINQSTGGQITFANSLIRNVVTLFLDISIFFVFFTKKRQTLSDIIAGAVVIETTANNVPNP